MEPKKDCQICTRKQLDKFVDGATIKGVWADMCLTCHQNFGAGLGTGKGQMYEYQNGTYVKIAG